ncbi:MAG: cation-translocating P-type ATPase [Oscillospiraceae bacterium]|nr:cation-translocating P-type ATPase [Oscillospiraceae bacterium]
MVYNKTTEQTLQDLGANPAQGLTAAEAAARLAKHGPNKLATAKKKPMILRVLAQFKDFLVLMLIGAAIISMLVPLFEGRAITGEDLKDPIIILAILLVNMIIGISQESRADNALAQLKNMASPKAKVRRNGVVEKLDSDQVVPGDIIVLDAGDYIPADLRLIETMNLKVDEAALTGESVPVEKDAAAVLPEDAPLGDRINLASMGTVVTYGRGVGVVHSTGMQTEMGKIATILSETDEAATPLQEKLNKLGKTLGIVCVITCAIVFGVGWLRGMGVVEMFMTAVALAVAAVPEGVAIVATVILAIGVQKMVKANVIVKKLRAVETLGSTTVICSDKTGTLTQNKMTVVQVSDENNAQRIAEIACLCNDATTTIGDPTEIAMVVYAEKLGIHKAELDGKYPRVQEIPFDSTRKLMSTYHQQASGKILMCTKGAPDNVIARCNMTDEARAAALAQNEDFARQALRVLAVAYKECDSTDCPEENLTFVGLMGMIDPPRDGVQEAVRECHNAGISVKMVTGDHKVTACAIAQQLGIIQSCDEHALDGNDLNAMSDDELKTAVEQVNVFARVSPEHKVRIVTAVKDNNNIVAMTGDGVNDAPSLKKADIGIAMGITGTDVSKEAADMILTDDNFVSIVGAVEQGRTIYGNIRKVTGYLLACNVAEILIILLAILFGLPVPLAATQLLFLNLLTDAFPAFGLGLERREAGVMNQKPRNPGEAIINRQMQGLVAFRAIFLTIACLGAFLFGLHFYNEIVAMSMCFLTLVAAELLLAYPCKTDAPMGRGLFANKFLNISMLISLGILVAVMYVPLLNDWFSVVPLSATQVLVSLGFMGVSIFGIELSKRLIKLTQ